MAIAKLTEDNLKDPGFRVALLTAINAAIDQVNNASGGGTPGPGTFTTLTTSNNVNIAGALPGLGNNGQLLNSVVTGTASTAGNCEALRGQVTGTFDCTSAGISESAVLGRVDCTRSAGAFSLSNIGVSGNCSGGQTNTGVDGVASGAATTNKGGNFAASGGTTNIALDASGGGDVKLGSATEKVGFFNSAGAVKGTVTGSRGANAALASLLTLLASYGILTDSSS